MPTNRFPRPPGGSPCDERGRPDHDHSTASHRVRAGQHLIQLGFKRSTTIADWMPLERERVDGVWLDPNFRCSDLSLPETGLGEGSLSSIVTLDLNDLSKPITGPIVAGWFDQIYSSRQMFVGARSEWHFDAPNPWGDARVVLLAFGLEPGKTTLDLSDPRRPTVLGQVEIPGFSEYVHPIDANHLLTIGRNADPDGRVQGGLMLQIFDVSTPTAPRRTHSCEFAPDGFSEASYHDYAFTFFKPEAGTGHDGLLAFPLVSYDQEFRSVLEVFDVSATGGFTHLGAVDHSDFTRNLCEASIAGPDAPSYYYNCRLSPEVRRGLFISGAEDTFVYSVSYGGVMAHDLMDLTRPLASQMLPDP